MNLPKILEDTHHCGRKLSLVAPTSIIFVATKVLSRQKTSWQMYACHDKTFVMTKLCVTNVLLRQAYFCHDKIMCDKRQQKWYFWQLLPVTENTHTHTHTDKGGKVDFTLSVQSGEIGQSWPPNCGLYQQVAAAWMLYLTTSLPQSVKFPGWKVHTYTPADSIFDVL